MNIFRKCLEAWRPRFSALMVVLYLVGCVSFSVGASLFIASDLGTDPLDVMALGLMTKLPLTVGICQAAFAALCLAVWATWNRKIPPISPFVTFAFCGSLIDLFMEIQLAERAADGLSPFAMMLGGVACCAYGSALIIMSGIGIRAMDLVAITMSEKWRAPFWACKGILELLLLVTGWALGGPVGVGTFFFLGVVGWMIQPLMRLSEVLLRLPNYGLPPRRALVMAQAEGAI